MYLDIQNFTKSDGTIEKPEASIILETVIDCLIEVGNGITDEDLHLCADLLLNFRDKWFKLQ